MFALNHTRMFRPLLGGICIQNEIARQVGTLGCIIDDGTNRWIISAYHVLVRPDTSQFSPGERIYQPTQPESPRPVAELVQGRSDRNLDVAAARLFQDVAWSDEVLGIGRLRGTQNAEVGLRVIKSGIATGVTEGVVTKVTDDRLEVTPPPGYPSKYELTTISDSGSVWIARDSHMAIGIHVAGDDAGEERAFAVPFARTLEALQIAPC